MHILHSLFTRGIGGTERHLAELANGQVEAGHTVSILMRDDRFPDGKPDPFPGWLNPEVRLIMISRRWLLFDMYRVLRQEQPDIIHTHHGRDGRYLARLARGRVPVVATLHMGYRRKDYRYHDGLICISPWQAEELPAAMRAHSVVISNWYRKVEAVSDVQRQELRVRAGVAEGEWLIGAVGRLYPQKGMDLLIDAFEEAAMPDCHLCIFGGGEMHRELEQRLQDVGTKQIRLMGYEAQVRPWYEAFDLFVMPSRWEPFGLVFLEAMASGCPIVATRTAGALDILNESNTVVWAEPGDRESLVQALKHARKMLGKRLTYPQLKHHEYRDAIDSVLRFYQQFLPG